MRQVVPELYPPLQNVKDAAIKCYPEVNINYMKNPKKNRIICYYSMIMTKGAQFYRYYYNRCSRLSRFIPRDDGQYRTGTVFYKTEKYQACMRSYIRITRQ